MTKILIFPHRMVEDHFQLMKTASSSQWIYGTRLEYHCGLAKGFYFNESVVTGTQVMECGWDTSWSPTASLMECVCE